jgi:hypothetical protein
MSHTPGPWKVEGAMRLTIVGGPGASVGVARIWQHGQEEANAKLIAAAPDLAKIAQEFVEYLEANEQSSWADNIRATLAKAGL